MLVVAAIAVLPVPYVTLSPGSTYNTLGSVNGVEVISISGTTTYPVSGHLDLTTVSESGGSVGQVTTGEAVRGLVDPDVKVLPRSVLFPESQDQRDAQKDQTEAFDRSENAALAAAMRYLGRPVTEQLHVASVAAGSPSDGVLKPGDVLESVNGTRLTASADLGRLVRAQPPGTAFRLGIRRDGAASTVTVTSAPRPDDPKVAYLGVTVATEYQAPFRIDFGLTDVGGPSAGMMLALGIIDKLTPAGLNGGRFVAGTGTITPEGEVGPIGGIAQKMVGARAAGAELFLAPRSNCDDVVGHVPEGLTVAAVGTLSDAVRVTSDRVAGRPVPACTSP